MTDPHDPKLDAEIEDLEVSPESAEDVAGGILIGLNQPGLTGQVKLAQGLKLDSALKLDGALKFEHKI